MITDNTTYQNFREEKVEDKNEKENLKKVESIAEGFGIPKTLVGKFHKVLKGQLTGLVMETKFNERSWLLDKIKDLQRTSKTYRKILDHRKTCNKWGKSFCLDCFGGGLTKYTDNLIDEVGILEKKGQNLYNEKAKG